MAKKKAARSFVLAEEIRNILKENPGYSGKEVYLALTAKFPEAKINEASASVAFSSARKKLGIPGGRAGSKKRGGRRVVRKARPAAIRPNVSMEMLQAAKKFLTEVGNPDKALEAIRQVTALQIK